MRDNTRDMRTVFAIGARGAMVAAFFVMVFAFTSGDQNSEANGAKPCETQEVAGVLLSPRTRLIIDYQRTALA